MPNPLSRAVTALRDAVSGRSRLAKYGAPEAHRHRHHRDVDLANHYIPTAPQVLGNLPTGM
ncbi:hypothetical protein [Streptomyces albidocamelliae]|uniref:Uncharacterized protein n=1 Tax=Streptomyces albidocamelliae TaxID=2981135 RepID=A0ABY6EY35_9ACTN|nr:hypothetical protein [Streptomyces sp. HUAS 14-6]UXY39315.1 hypothetical protein N8I86_34180 [Streptomyces sp. HUAS 14-6]